MPKLVAFKPSSKFKEDYKPPQISGGEGGGHIYEKSEYVSTSRDISDAHRGGVGKSLEELGLGQGGEPYPKSKKALKKLLVKYQSKSFPSISGGKSAGYSLSGGKYIGPEMRWVSKTQIDKLWDMIVEKQLGSTSVGGIGGYTPFGKVGKTIKKIDLGEGATVKTAKGVIQPGKDVPFEAQQRQILQPIETDLNILYEQLDPKNNPLADDLRVQDNLRSQIADLEVDKDILKKEMGESYEQTKFKEQTTRAYESRIEYGGERISEEALEFATQDVENIRQADLPPDIKGKPSLKKDLKKVAKKQAQAKRISSTGGIAGFGETGGKALTRSRELYKQETTVDGKTYIAGDPKHLKGKKAIYSLEKELQTYEGKTFIKDAEGRVIGERVYDAKKGVTLGAADPVKYYEMGGGDIVTGRTKRGKIKTAKLLGPISAGLEPEGYSLHRRTVSLTGESIQQANKRNEALAKAAGWDTPSWSPTKYEKISKDYSALVNSGQIDAGKMNWNLVISDIDAGKGMGGIADYTRSAIVPTGSAIVPKTGSVLSVPKTGSVLAVPKTTPDLPKGPKSPKAILDSVEQSVVDSMIKKGIKPEPSRIKEIADIIKKRGKGKFIKYGAIAGTLSVIQGLLEAKRDK